MILTILYNIVIYLLGFTLFSIGIFVYMGALYKKYKRVKFNKIYKWTQKRFEKTTKVSWVLAYIESIISPINILILISTKWKYRL